MTVRSLLYDFGYASDPDADMTRCPFHNDRVPSAKLMDNGIYCFACGRAYRIRDIARLFHVYLEYVPDGTDAHVVDNAKYVYVSGDKSAYAEKGRPLFTYAFHVRAIPKCPVG